MTAARIVAGLVAGLAAGLAIVAPVHAEPRAVELRLTREPGPRHLRMRPRAAAAPTPTPPPRPRTPMPRAPTASATSPEPIAGLDGLRDVTQPVSFSLALGYQVDNARQSGQASLDGRTPVAGRDYAALRSYGFGEAFVSTRGVGLASLQTYFAARFQAARDLQVTARADDPVLPDRSLAAPIATWFDRTGGELRTGWAELRDFLPARWGLRRLRVRAGDQFVYGPWIVHLAGANVAYDGPALSASAYVGQRRSDYSRALEDNQPVAVGASAKLDLRGLTQRVPIVVSGDYLTLSASTVTAQPATQSGQLQFDWRPRRDIAVIGQLRSLDGELANQHLEVRTRYKDVTNLVFEVMRRFATDWRWDPTLVQREAAATEARRYLDLGPVLPQLLLSARGGTLIAENVDLFARVARASDLHDDGEDGSGDGGVRSSFSAPYLELAGALEIRLRRQLAVGFSGLRRTTDRPPPMPIYDERLTPQPLPADAQMGDDGFTEVGTTVRLTLGARRFSAVVEVYGRRTRTTPLYEDPLLPLPDSDVRGGGRVSVDAWVGKRMRLFASYDVSSALDAQPEVSGYKSLRLVATGVY